MAIMFSLSYRMKELKCQHMSDFSISIHKYDDIHDRMSRRMSVTRLWDQSGRNLLNTVRMVHARVHSHRIQQMLTSLRKFDVIHGNTSHFKPSQR